MKYRKILLFVLGFVFLCPLLTTSLPFFRFGAWEGWKVWQDYQTFETIDGEVIQNILTTSQQMDSSDPTFYYESNTYQAVIRFETLNGTIETFTDNSGSYPAKYDIGDGAIVMYYPSRPIKCQDTLLGIVACTCFIYGDWYCPRIDLRNDICSNNHHHDPQET